MKLNNNNNLEPIFNKKNAICFGLDDSYAKYFSVVLSSLIEVANKHENYDVIVLNNNITDVNKNKLKANLPNNISLRFYNIDSVKEKYIEKGVFKPKEYWSESMYYRLLIPMIFNNYEKVLYCDSDIVFNRNADEIFNIDFDSKKLLVISDSIVQELKYDTERKHFISCYLGLKNASNYFNSGVLLFNLKKINTNKYIEQLTETLLKYDKLLFPDQDILNIIFENEVKYISQVFNFQVNIPIYQFEHLPTYDKGFLEDYYKSFESPIIIHYSVSEKPWHNPKLIFHEKFWAIARKSLFYEEIIYENYNKKLNLILGKTVIERKYLIAKILSIITFGKTKKEYIEKRTNLKKKLRLIRNTVNEVINE